MAADVLGYNNYLPNEQTETTLIQNTSMRLGAFLNHLLKLNVSC